MIYSLLFAAASIYAGLLSTPAGREFADKRTAESVVIGVSLVLVALRFRSGTDCVKARRTTHSGDVHNCDFVGHF